MKQPPALSLGAEQTSQRILAIAAVAGVVLSGLFLRLWILGRMPFDSSTAVTGLMAREILHGHFSAFYWGQNYGGAEPYVVAVMFALFGESQLTLGLTPVLLDVVAAVLVWRIGRRLFSPGIGIGAALLFWIGPEVYVFDSTQEYGFRFVTLVCGLAVMLLAIRIAQREETPHIYVGKSQGSRPVVVVGTTQLVLRLDWLGLGLFAGIGWWASPEIAYYLAPSIVFLVWRFLRGRLRFRPSLVALGATSAVLGALPWLWVNVPSRFSSLRNVSDQPHQSYTSHLSTFFTKVAPIVMGLRLRQNYDPVHQAWVPGAGGFLVSPGPRWWGIVGALVYMAVGSALLVWVVVLIRRRQALILAGAFLAFPLLYAFSPFAGDWQDGRYGLFLAPLLTLLVASGLSAAFNRLRTRELAIPLAVLMSLTLTLVAVAQLYPYIPVSPTAPYTPVSASSPRSGWFTWHPNPNPEETALTRDVESAHLNKVWSGYYIARMFNWESHGRLTASDVRYGPTSYYSALAAARAPAWLFANPSWDPRTAGAAVDQPYQLLNPGCLSGQPDYCLTPGEFESFLARRDIAYRVVGMGPLIAIEPSRGIPRQVLAAFHRSVSARAALGD